MKTLEDLQPFASLLAADQKTGCIERGYTWEIHAPTHAVSVKMGKKFARVDIGDSGRYMVDLETGEIYGIKGYGVVHRGHQLGTLDTIHEWDWSDYRAVRKQRTFASAPAS